MPEIRSDDLLLSLNLEKYSSKYKKNEKIYGKYALANDFVRLPKNIDSQPLKVLGLILSKLDFKKNNKNERGLVEVNCTLAEIIRACGQNGSNYKNYEYYKSVIEKLVKNSYVKGVINGIDIMGYAVPLVKSIPDAENISFTFTIFENFLPYFQLLASNYTIIELEQAKKFKSRFSYILYINLLSWRTKLDQEYYQIYTTKQLKDMFGLSKNDYCRKNGSFDRKNFEMKTIDLAIKEINKLTKLKVMYIKNKKGHLVSNYQFHFIEYNEV